MHYIAGMFVRVVVYVSLETVLANAAHETRTVNVWVHLNAREVKE